MAIPTIIRLSIMGYNSGFVMFISPTRWWVRGHLTTPPQEWTCWGSYAWSLFGTLRRTDGNYKQKDSSRVIVLGLQHAGFDLMKPTTRRSWPIACFRRR